MQESQPGISLPQIRLPKGGGAIRGVGETFQPSSFTGTASFTLPIETPTARDLSLDLSLSYSSGSSQGPFGLGFSLSTPHIVRRTEKRLPDYSDADEFVLSNVEYLVPTLIEQGDQWVTQDFDGDNGTYRVRRYRTRTEGSFLRVERWTRRADGDVHWRVTTAENVTSIYGESPIARIAHPENPQQIFQWLIERTEDSRGNQIRYTYRAEDGVGIANTVYEQGRDQTVQRYLQKIEYGNFFDENGQTQWAFSVVFDYGDYDLSDLDSLTADPTGTWSARPDPFSDYRAGFEVRTHRLCRNILVFHHFPDELGVQDALVRSLHLTYTESPVITFLQGVQSFGYRRSPDGIEVQPTPPVTFDYSDYDPLAQTFQPLQAEHSRLPLRLDGTDYQLLDIYGEGITGLFYDRQGTHLYYRPQGNGVYETGQPLAEYPIEQFQNPPLYTVTDGLFTRLNVRAGGRSGYYQRDSETSWDNFQAFQGTPVDYSNPDFDATDVTGDGRPDLLLFEADQVRVYPSAGTAGHSPSITALRSPQLPVQADPGGAEKLLLVDMVGDGLSDRVRVRNGAVMYWPNLGYGNFGHPVVMANAPHFEGRFNADRLYLTDIDGSGTADLVYVTGQEARVYVNQSGNRFSDPVVIPLPEPPHTLNQVQFADIRGNGTSCLVFTSGTDPLRHQFYDFTGGVKPHLLIGIDNHRGAVTRIRYAPSTQFYLADRRAGQPWISRLPFPVQLVEKTERIDLIAKTKQVSRYTYHHGAYDFVEREFAGFGLVERWDSEGFEQFSTTSLLAETPFELLPSDLHAPPIHTKTWYHTGLRVRDGVLSRQYAEDYYSGDRRAYDLPDSSFEQAGNAESLQVAYRALRGKVLREEIYGEDDDSQLSEHPYRVSETAYRLRFMQPTQAGHNSVYLPMVRERLTYHYERNPDDPRILHEFKLVYDDFGRLTRQARVAYGRRDRALVDHPDQSQIQGTYTYQSFIHLSGGVYRLGIPSETQRFELGGLQPDQGAYYSWQELADQYPNPEQTALDYHQSATGRFTRLLMWQRSVYWNQAQTRALALGQATGRRLLHNQETAIYPVEGLATLFADTREPRLNQILLSLDADGGAFVERQRSTGSAYYVDPGVIAEYGDATAFYQGQRYTDQFGTVTDVAYDPYRFAVVELAARLSAQQSLVQTVAPDYQALQPARVIDINQNTTEYGYDPLGRVRVSSRYGRENNQLRGDRPLDQYRLPADLSLDAILANPQIYLQQTTRFYTYDLMAWEERQQPLYGIQIQRHRYTSDLAAGDTSPVQIQLDYSDGFGRSLQSKQQVEPGLAWVVQADGTVVEQTTSDRWLTTGRTVYNNKGQVVKQYEPFYAEGAAYQPERILTDHGVTAVRHYDPLGRVFQTDLPKGFLTRSEYFAWRVDEYDANDTVRQSPYYATQNGNLPADDQDALDKAAAHSDTPLEQALDVWGRPILNRQRLSADTRLTTYKRLDVVGNVVGLQDPRFFDPSVDDLSGEQSRFNFEADYDMLGRSLRQISVDRGSRWTLLNAGGDEIHRWDGRGFHHATHYDALSRPIALFVTGNGLNHQLERIEYGETISDSTGNNLRGQLSAHYDSAGMLAVDRYSLTGQATTTRRQLRENYQAVPNWAQSEAIAPETWRFQRRFDVLNRPIELTYPDGRQVRYGYTDSGRLRSLTHREPGQADQPIVTNIDYNARDQRTQVSYGNRVETRFDYDPLTFNLNQINTRRTSDGRTLQDLQYTYDPSGNVTRLGDRSNRVLYTNNQVVLPRLDYTYDAIYRLTQAEGREHRGLYQPANAIQPDYQDFLPQPPSVNNAQALETYTRNFNYDAASNLQQIQHRAASRSFNRTITISDNSNRGNVAPDNGVINPEQDYDANGNLTRLDHLRAMGWNSLNQLAAVDIIQRNNNPNDSETYNYDASGRRVRKVYERLVNGAVVIEETIYFGDFEVHRTRRGNQTQEAYTTVQISDGRSRLATLHLWSRRPQGQNFTRQTRYQLSTLQNSAAFELDSSGQIITYEEYFPYGGTAVIAGRSQREVNRKRYRYAGRERDATTHLYYYGARYYAPWMGRWLSPDPAGALDGANLYLYVRGNPVRHTDQDGQVAVELNNEGQVARLTTFFNGLGAVAAAPPPPTRTPQRVSIEAELRAIPQGVVAQRRAAFEARLRPAPANNAASATVPNSGQVASAPPTAPAPQAQPTRTRSVSAPTTLSSAAAPPASPDPVTRNRSRTLTQSNSPSANVDNANNAQPSGNQTADPPPAVANAENDGSLTVGGISSDRRVLVLFAAALQIAKRIVELVTEARRLAGDSEDAAPARSRGASESSDAGQQVAPVGSNGPASGVSASEDENDLGAVALGVAEAAPEPESGNLDDQADPVNEVETEESQTQTDETEEERRQRQ